MKKIILILLVLLGLQTQAQIAPCDSLSYQTSSTINYPFGVTGMGTANIPGTVSWVWTVCNSSMCYSATGTNASFGQVSITDTLKVCYDVYIDINGMTYTCSRCDTLIYDQNSYQWIPKISNPTSITDIPLNTISDSKIYDLLGRELKSIPIGKLYIRDRRLCICK